MATKGLFTAEQVSNLQRVVTVIEGLSDSQCYMGNWVERDGKLRPRRERGKPECGTAACLAGWGALLCAPTIDAEHLEVGDYYLHDDGDLAVPVAWAKAYGVRTWKNSDYRLPAGFQIAGVSDIARSVLGQPTERLYMSGAGPDETDQQWMVKMLHALLMYDQLLKIAGLDDPHEEWDRDDREDNREDNAWPY